MKPKRPGSLDGRPSSSTIALSGVQIRARPAPRMQWVGRIGAVTLMLPLNCRAGNSHDRLDLSGACASALIVEQAF